MLLASGVLLGLMTFGLFLLPDNRIQVAISEVRLALRAVPGPKLMPEATRQIWIDGTALKTEKNKTNPVSQEKKKTTRKRNSAKLKSKQKPKPIGNKKKGFTIERVDTWLEEAKRKQQTKRVRQLETILLKMMEGEPLSQKDRDFLTNLKRNYKAD